MQALVVFVSEISLIRFYFYVNNSCVNAVVTFSSQVIVVFLLFLGMVMYANEVKTRTLSQRRLSSLAWRLDREIGRRLLLHETGFTR